MRKFKKLTITLALLLMAVGGAWAQEETLLTTITPTAKEQANYSTANVATVSFSYTADGSSAYLANWGWWGYGWTATVTAAEGYTITKCIFYDDADRKATDSEAPFVVETTDGDKTPRINGTPIDGGNMWSKGIKKIEVYGYKSAPAEPTEWSLTPDETGKTWTLANMPANNIELQVEYYAESNLFLSKNALADKTNIAVTAGDLGVQFGNDGKSANTITEGTPMTVTYNGTKKVIGFKVEKKAEAASLIVNPVVGQIIGSDGKNYDANATLPDGVTKVAMIAYVGNDAETSPTYNHGLALALEDVDVSGKKAWCSQTSATCLPTQYSTAETAKGDMAGIANTDALVNHTGHTHAAASAARGYNNGTHPAGTSAWFLPSAGQWDKMAKAAGDYATLRDNAGLNEDDLYLSSTEYNANFAWDFNTNYGDWSRNNKDNDGDRVRACLAF